MPKGYSSAQIGLHWIIALLIALQFLFNEPMGEAFDSALEGEVPPFSWAVWAHIAGGIAILALVLWRVALRRSRGAPPPPEGEGSLLGRACARVSLLMDLVPGREGSAVIDPYGGTEEDFAAVWDDVTMAVRQLVARIGR